MSSSFSNLLDAHVERSAAELDTLLRENELEVRRLAAERAAIVSAIEGRGDWSAEHRSMSGYLRATVNGSDPSASKDRRLARLLSDHPVVGEAVLHGLVTVDHALQIARVHGNPRIRHFADTIVPILVDLAEHTSYRDFAEQVTHLIARLDQDGAFADVHDAVAGRRASVVEVGGSVSIRALGGDAVQAARLQAVFDQFVEAEYRRDIDHRRELHGDDASSQPLARTHGQRCFDALVAIFSAAGASPDGRRLPDVVVNVVVDATTVHDTLTHAGIVLPQGERLDLGETGLPLDVANDLFDEFAADPEAFLARRCETPNGSPIHPSVLLRSLLTGHVRRAVIDSRSVVIDYGTKQRLFTGLAREAAMLLARTCVFPGCDLRRDWAQIDHNDEWHEDGPTDQRNANVGCGHHNRIKHRQRWRTRRDARGRCYTVRSDDTIILPVGERPPDLSVDEAIDAARTRLRSLLAA